MARFVVEADGGSRGNPGPAAFGAIVRDAGTGDELVAIGEYLGECTNNVAEYQGLIAGLRAVASLDATASVEVRMDSKLVVEQMSGRWKIKHADMQKLALTAREILPVSQVRYTWIPREHNRAADAVVNEVLDAVAAGALFASRAMLLAEPWVSMPQMMWWVKRPIPPLKWCD
jgi:ribonuclease H / adenosylcobalamin/alpha-ribazole phosphatase